LISFVSSRNYTTRQVDDFFSGYAVKCNDHAIWIITGIDVSIVSKSLPAGVTLDTVPEDFAKELLPGYHPVIFELGIQQNCKFNLLPIFGLDFYELKYEIPYVKTETASPLESKPVIYMSNFLNVLSSRGIYGIPAVLAQSMSASFNDNSNLFFSTTASPGVTFQSTFSTDEEFGTYSDSIQFGTFDAVNDYRWMGDLLLGKKCARNYYDWGSMKIRPIKTGSVSFTDSFFPGIPKSEFSVSRPTRFLGASEVIVDLYISYPSDC